MDFMTFTLNTPMFDFLVLSIIAEGDAYGYQISQIIKRVSDTKDSALYPILKKLQENGYVETYDQQFQGRNRKYYKITQSGKIRQEHLKKEWKEYITIIDDIVNDSGSGTGKCCQTAKNNETALFRFMDRYSGTFCSPDRTASGTLYPGCARIPDPWKTCSRWRYLSHCTCRSGRKRAWHHWRNCDHPSDSWGRTGYDRSVSDADRLWNPGHIFHHITGSLDHHQTCRTARQTCEKRGKKT